MPLPGLTLLLKIEERCVVQADSNTENRPENNASTEMEDLKKALTEEKSKCEANLMGWQRAQADFVNYKRFAEQDKAETCKFANVGLLAAILPVMDDFERALAAVPEDKGSQKWLEGFALINRKFKDTLHKQGVTQIQALGMEFDPHTMEAMTTAKGRRDIVVQELERGYKLQDKVIRPARVIVGSGEEDNKEES
jgi:molecular chaperone GrpE